MKRLTTIVCVAVCCALGHLTLTPDAVAQGVSLELSGGSDHPSDDLGYGAFAWPVFRYGNLSTTRTGRLGIDARLAFSIGERWELGAAVGLQRATLNLVALPSCFDGDCSTRTLSSAEYTELVTALATARFWPMGVADRPLAVRPLVGLHTGFVSHDNGLGVVVREFVDDREFVGEDTDRGVPVGLDAGFGMAISDRAYVLAYMTGRMLMVPAPDGDIASRDPFCAVRPHSGRGDPCVETLEGDGFGFRWGVRLGVGIRL